MNLISTSILPIKDKKALAEKLLYILIAFWLIIQIFNQTYFKTDSALLSHKIIVAERYFRISFILMFLLLSYLHKTKINVLKILFFIALCVLFRIYNKTYICFDLFFVPLFLCNFLEQKKFIKLCFFVLLVSLVSIALLSQFDTFSTKLVFETNTREESFTRHALGMIHPNLLGFFVVVLCFLYFLIEQKTKILSLLIFICAYIFCYTVPNSVTSTIIIFLLVIGSVALNILNKLKPEFLKKHYFNLLILLMILICVGTYLLTFTGAYSVLLGYVRHSLLARFEYSLIAIDKYGFTFLGSLIEFCGDYDVQIRNINKYFTVDCAFFYIPIRLGICFYLFYLFVFITLLRKAILQNSYQFGLILLLIVVYGFSETMVIASAMMPIYAYMFCKKSENKDNTEKLTEEKS